MYTQSASAKTFSQLCFLTIALTWFTVNIVTSRVFLTLPDLDFLLFSTIQCSVIAGYVGLRDFGVTYIYGPKPRVSEPVTGSCYESVFKEFLKHAYFSASYDYPTRFIVGVNWVSLGLMSWYIGLGGMDFKTAFFHSTMGDVFILLISATNGAIIGNYMYSLVRVIWNRTVKAN